MNKLFLTATFTCISLYITSSDTSANNASSAGCSDNTQSKNLWLPHPFSFYDIYEKRTFKHSPCLICKKTEDRTLLHFSMPDFCSNCCKELEPLSKVESIDDLKNMCFEDRLRLMLALDELLAYKA